MSSDDRPELAGFAEDARAESRRAAFEALPSTSYVPGSVEERLELLFELNELAVAVAGSELDLRSVNPPGDLLL